MSPRINMKQVWYFLKKIKHPSSKPLSFGRVYVSNNPKQWIPPSPSTQAVLHYQFFNFVVTCTPYITHILFSPFTRMSCLLFFTYSEQYTLNHASDRSKSTRHAWICLICFQRGSHVRHTLCSVQVILSLVFGWGAAELTTVPHVQVHKLFYHLSVAVNAFNKTLETCSTKSSTWHSCWHVSSFENLIKPQQLWSSFELPVWIPHTGVCWYITHHDYDHDQEVSVPQHNILLCCTCNNVQSTGSCHHSNDSSLKLWQIISMHHQITHPWHVSICLDKGKAKCFVIQ